MQAMQEQLPAHAVSRSRNKKVTATDGGNAGYTGVITCLFFIARLYFFKQVNHLGD